MLVVITVRMIMNMMASDSKKVNRTVHDYLLCNLQERHRGNLSVSCLNKVMLGVLIHE